MPRRNLQIHDQGAEQFVHFDRLVVSGRAFGRGQLLNLKANRVAIGTEINGSLWGISGVMSPENCLLSLWVARI